MPFVILPTNSASGGYDITNSLRFNQPSSDNLTRTPASTTNRRTFTLSFWLKRASLASGNKCPFAVGNSSVSISDADWFILMLHGSTNTLRLVQYNNVIFATNRVFRDISAWYHIVVAVDTTQATASNRVKLYINGTQETSYSSSADPTLNYDFAVNTTTQHMIGREDGAGSVYFDGYLSEYNFIDGQQLTPSSFGETDSDTGIWKPKAYTGTFGTNGFYLQFKNSASLGTDSSGNGNTFTVNNLTSIDQTTDTPTNNFATMNPLNNNNASLAFTNGNLEVTSSTSWLGDTSTFGVSKGKWYWEVKYISGNIGFGIGKIGTSATATGNLSTANTGYVGNYPDGYEYFKNFSNSQKINNNSTTSYGTVASTNDILMVAFNADIGAIWVGRNGTWYASATQAEIEAGTTTNAMFSGITINDFFTPTGSFENGALQYNFGSPPFTIASGNADANGYGNFEYAVPSGYYALCTKNLATFG